MADLVELFPDSERTDHDAPLTKREGTTTFDQRMCPHHRLELDTDARRAYCRDCGIERPAFDALVQLKNEWERYVEARKHAMRQARQVSERLQQLERDERNAKARVRNAGRRAVSLVVGADGRAPVLAGLFTIEELRVLGWYGDGQYDTKTRRRLIEEFRAAGVVQASESEAS